MKTKSVILSISFLNLLTYNLHAEDSSKSYPVFNSDAAKNKHTLLCQSKIDRAEKQVIFDKENLKPQKKNVVKNAMIAVGSLIAAGAVFWLCMCAVGILGFVVVRFAPIIFA